MEKVVDKWQKKLLYFTDQDIIFFEVLKTNLKNFSDNLLILLTILIFFMFLLSIPPRDIISFFEFNLIKLNFVTPK